MNHVATEIVLVWKFVFYRSSVTQIPHSCSLPPVDMRYVIYIHGHYFSQVCKRTVYAVVLCSTYFEVILLNNKNNK